MENSRKGGFGKGGNGGGFRKPGGFHDRKTFARPSFGGDRPDFKKKPWDSRGGKSFTNDDREMFSATCSGCGKSCQVPFMPSSGKPVFCDECFSKERNNAPMRNNSSAPSYNDRAPRAAGPAAGCRTGRRSGRRRCRDRTGRQRAGGGQGGACRGLSVGLRAVGHRHPQPCVVQAVGGPHCLQGGEKGGFIGAGKA